MNKKSSTSPLDAALAQVDPERRRFLAMLLAGVAAAPLLTSSDLVAQEKQVTDKNATWTKGGVTAGDRAEEIKSSGSKSDIKAMRKEGPLDYGQTVKGAQPAEVKSLGSKSDIKYWRKEGTTSNPQVDRSTKNSWPQNVKSSDSNVKTGNPAVKSDVIELKTQSPTRQ
jgi:hypothetical protein